MSNKPNPARIGGFVIGAVAIAVAAVATFGSGRFFERAERFVCYFEGSVNGLAVGSNVKFKGVPIGSVSEILLRLDQSDDGGGGNSFRDALNELPCNDLFDRARSALYVNAMITL